jgi:predicted transcriptional regulator
MSEVHFSERELDVMSVLWRLGSGTVTVVQEALEDDLGYTSVLKMLQILEEKGRIRHESEGRAYRYFPTVAPETAGDSAVGRIVNKIFDGSAELLLARLVSSREIPAEELARMRRMLEEAEAASVDPPSPSGKRRKR